MIGKTLAMDGTTSLDQSATANPCGLVAKSFFNDEFTLKDSSNQAITISYFFE